MFLLNPTGIFKKDFKIFKKRNYDLTLLEDVLAILMELGELPKKYKPHKLSGNYKNH
jgi:mRNA interferase YafQ